MASVSVSAEQRLDDMMWEYCKPGRFKFPKMDELRYVLSQMLNQAKIDILQKEYAPWHSPLYCAAYRSHTNIVWTLLTSVESAGRMKLLLSSNKPLHDAALDGKTESVEMILDCLTADQQLQIMSVQQNDKTPIQLAQKRGRTDTAVLLRKYQYLAECVQRAECVQIGEYLTSKPVALILYNPISREGAVEEADNLQSGLKAVGCQGIRGEWTTKVQLSELINYGLQTADGCSLLMVCIMSHGHAGKLKCEDGDGFVVINDVLFQFSRKLPENLPMVMLVQACQQTKDVRANCGDDMALRCSPEDNTHIVLDRPHTLLLFSSMRDGFAKRGAYTDALAQQLKQADGKSDIHDMHIKAVLMMTGKYGDKQTPEYRSTLKKHLVLSGHKSP